MPEFTSTAKILATAMLIFPTRLFCCILFAKKVTSVVPGYCVKWVTEMYLLGLSLEHFVTF